jgi:hypothetical protein
MSGEGHGWYLGQVKVVLVVLELDVDNLHTFAIEKKAQRKRRMFNMEYNIKSYIF